MNKHQVKSNKSLAEQKWKRSRANSETSSDKCHVPPVTMHQMFHKVKNSILRGVTKIKTMKVEKASTDSEISTNNENPENSASYGTFESLLENKQCSELTLQIRQALAAVQNSLGAQVLVPCGLISKISRDIMNMAHSEPCGLRGCVVYINLQEKNKCQKIVKLVCDPETVSTFELFLTLEEETRGWCMLKRLFISVSGCLEKKPWSSGIKMLCSGYNLEKKKLYRSN